ncbi:MAG: GNAT family N-acetyltransferase [Planctomycetota bacterium]|jgi:phosphinothricin acetyltransferase
MVEIRRATEADVEAICRVSNQEAARSAANFAIEPEPLEDWLRNFRETQEFYPWLITVGGFAKAGPWQRRDAYSHTVETTVYIEPGSQGKGLGRALCERLFALLEAQGYHVALAGITLPNEPSVRLHESLGMRKVAQFEEVGWKFDRWWDVGIWQRLLRDEPAGRIRAVSEVWPR